MNSFNGLMETFMQSDMDKRELKKTAKRKDIIALLLKLKTLYLEQQSLIKDIENQLKELLKTTSGFKEREENIHYYYHNISELLQNISTWGLKEDLIEIYCWLGGPEFTFSTPEMER